MREMDLPKTPEPMDAGAQLDSILREGRVPDPTDVGELGAHLERIRRRLAEKHPPSAASMAAVAAPHSLLEGIQMERRGPDDSLAVVIVIVLVAVLALGAGFLLGQEAASSGGILWTG